MSTLNSSIKGAVHLSRYHNDIKYFSTAAHESAYSTSLFCNLMAIFSNMIISIATEIDSLLGWSIDLNPVV